MTKAAIMPVPTETGGISYRGVAGETHSQGKTIGEALDALTTQLPGDDAVMLIVVQSLRPDRFFSAFQQQHLAELMEQWREANGAGISLSTNEQAELDALVEGEVIASGNRAAFLAEQARQ